MNYLVPDDFMPVGELWWESDYSHVREPLELAMLACVGLRERLLDELLEGSED